MYCKYCGQQLNDGEKFCNKCGKPTEEKKGSFWKTIIIIVLVALLLAGLMFLAKHLFFNNGTSENRGVLPVIEEKIIYSKTACVLDKKDTKVELDLEHKDGEHVDAMAFHVFITGGDRIDSTIMELVMGIDLGDGIKISDDGKTQRLDVIVDLENLSRWADIIDKAISAVELVGVKNDYFTSIKEFVRKIEKVDEINVESITEVFDDFKFECESYR